MCGGSRLKFTSKKARQTCLSSQGNPLGVIDIKGSCLINLMVSFCETKILNGVECG